MVAFDGTYLQQLLCPSPPSLTDTFSLIGGSWTPVDETTDNALFAVTDSEGNPRDSLVVTKATDMFLGKVGWFWNVMDHYGPYMDLDILNRTH